MLFFTPVVNTLRADMKGKQRWRSVPQKQYPWPLCTFLHMSLRTARSPLTVCPRGTGGPAELALKVPQAVCYIKALSSGAVTVFKDGDTAFGGNLWIWFCFCFGEEFCLVSNWFIIIFSHGSCDYYLLFLVHAWGKSFFVFSIATIQVAEDIN